MVKTIWSPIRYMGGKGRLINRGLIELFPKDIDCFYDMFGGSGIVSLNVSANKYWLNEKDEMIFMLYKYIKETSPEAISSGILKYMEKYNMPHFSTDARRKGITKELREYHKDNYIQMRNELNKSLGPLEVLTLMYFSMSTTIRFNKERLFNMPCGNGYFNAIKHGNEIKEMNRFLNYKHTTITNYDIFDINQSKFSYHDFIYLDPPYVGSVATYNEGDQWNERDNERLFKYIDVLDRAGIRFGLSNIAANKNGVNERLLNWVENRGFKVYYFDDFDYTSFGKGKTKTSEIYIYNY